MLKNFGWVALAAITAAMPGALYLNGQSGAPVWYTALVSLSSALGVGIFAIVIGWIILVAARRWANGGLKIAVVSAAVIGLLSSWAVISSIPTP